jgi:murein DD-endopeptidase MepM/ murein hydrolase activator NlpD
VIARRVAVDMRTVFGDPTSISRRESVLARRIRLLAAAHEAPGGPAPSLDWPVEGRFTYGYGDRFGRMHHGIDIGVPDGTPIAAVADGVVILSEDLRDYGTTTVISHAGGLASVYGHQKVSFASVGQTFRRGDILGLVGSTGRSTGPHLHFEIRREGNPCDPASVLPDRSS